MTKLISALVLMVSASFLPACAMDAGGGEDPGTEGAQIAAEGTASAASELTSCPSPATCLSADRLCQDPEAYNQQWACSVLTYCIIHCGYGVD